MQRRSFIKQSATLPLTLGASVGHAKDPQVISAIKVHEVKVNQRGNWYLIELKTNKGLTGIGEASHGFALKDGPSVLLSEIKHYFELIKGSPLLAVGQFRQHGLPRAVEKGKTSATAFSGVEQALWDLAGKSLNVPVYALLGGKLHEKLKVYANINRATNERDTGGKRKISSFQKNAEEALKQGFKAVKLAPFDEMSALNKSNPQQIKTDIDYAISCIEAVRSTIGPSKDLLIDVHSHLDKTLAVDTAKRLEESNLYWYEEAIDPAKFPAETKYITDQIGQRSAGGEAIFGRKGFAELIANRALDVIMPDVKHCGGIQELRFIAAMAEAADGISVAPHNPSGPVATAASVQVCASIPNFSILEYAHGEVPWRADLLSPAERFVDGYIHVPDAPGLGHSLNKAVLDKHTV